MLGTMPDFNNATHIDLTHDVGSYIEGSLVASCFSNSFGDKIVYYRILVKDGKWSSFETMDIKFYPEGEYPSFNEMLNDAQGYMTQWMEINKGGVIIPL